MFIYEITEYDRQQIIHMLEWAEWAIREHMTEAVGSSLVSLEVEKAEMGALWDHIATMEPSRLDEDAMADRVNEIKADLQDVLGE